MDSEWTLTSVLKLSLAGSGEDDKIRYLGIEKNSETASLKKNK